MKRMALALLGVVMACPVMAQNNPVGPSEEMIGPGKGETIRLGFGLYGGYMMAKKLMGGGAGTGGGVFTIGSFFEPASVAISLGAASGGGNMDAYLDFAARNQFYQSRGKSFYIYGGLGFGVHATPEFFADDGYDMSGLSAGVFLQTGAERTVTEEISLWFNGEYGIINSTGTPNYLQGTAGIIIYGR